MNEENEEQTEQPFYKKWTSWFIFIYLFFIAIYTLIFALSEGENVMLSSNELGDFLAGSFAPLAFLFLYLGYKQQGKELRQNTRALNIQAAELRISNEALKQQVEEMSKSVKAQQDMFILAERQYNDSIDEKVKKSTPQLVLAGSQYDSNNYGSSIQYKHTFDLTLKIQNQSIKNLKIRSNSWYIAGSDGSYDQSLVFEIDSIDINKPTTLKLYIHTNATPFQDNILNFDYYDESNVKYSKKYQITNNQDKVVLFEEISSEA